MAIHRALGNVRFDEDGLSASARARSHLSRSLRRVAVARLHVFPRQVPCHASLDQVRPGGHPAVGTGETGHDTLSGVVSRSEAPQQGQYGIPQGRFLADYFSSGGGPSGLCWIFFFANLPWVVCAFFLFGRGPLCFLWCLLVGCVGGGRVGVGPLAACRHATSV